MPAQDIARQWFILGEGIERQVISADIQRYLGNDATVRPGVGTGENQGVNGYWIKAYRNLTSAMIADLRADSVRWRQEQRQTGSRDPYVGSRTYEEGSASRAHNSRREGGSPALAEGPYGAPAAGQRVQDPRSRVGEQMMVDAQQPPNQRYPGQPPARGYQQEPRDYPENSRDYSRPQPNRPYQPDQVMSDAYAPPVSAPYGQEARYAPAPFGQPGDGAPPGYVRQGDYYVPVSSGFSAPVPPAGRPDPFAAPGYGQAQPQYREPRDPRDARESRYGGQPEFADPRNAYPSPAATVSSAVNPRDREPMMSPPQPSQYNAGQPQYDQQYGQRKYYDARPVGAPANAASPAAPNARSGYPQPDPAYAPPPSRDQGYGREGRKPAAPPADRRRRH